MLFQINICKLTLLIQYSQMAKFPRHLLCIPGGNRREEVMIPLQQPESHHTYFSNHKMFLEYFTTTLNLKSLMVSFV